MDPKTDPCEFLGTEINHHLENSSREPVMYTMDSPILFVSIYVYGKIHQSALIIINFAKREV